MSNKFETCDWVDFLTEERLSNRNVDNLKELTTLCGGDFERHVNGLDISGFDDDNDHITYLVYQEWSGSGVGFWSTALDFHEPTKTILEGFGRKVNNGSLDKRIYDLLIKVDLQISEVLCGD